MGRKFIIEEVEEESKFGCGSIIATIIIALVIGLCGGFKSCKEDKARGFIVLLEMLESFISDRQSTTLTKSRQVT